MGGLAGSDLVMIAGIAIGVVVAATHVIRGMRANRALTSKKKGVVTHEQ